MGAVELLTDDLAPMRSFYVDAVGLELLDETDDRLSLGSDGEEVLGITRAADRPADIGTEAGLYHSAIVYPNEQSLATALLSVATVAPTSYSGSADHAVSLAFYFSDPDGNGLELYTDTPEDEWVWNDGLVQMGSAALDPNAFIQEHLGTTPTDSGATMGHVHLRVGDLEKARAFYADTLGFAITAESEDALFYAAGGYHHHIATNTWGTAGATARPESLGLGSLTIHLGDKGALLAVADRLTDAAATFTHDAGVITVDDPWGNTVRLLA
ncbi:VOC family protein [Leifsonia kafniensis]|uniref:VOC family protein n=2 Tax=Leifsonia kafniensis TaxID=475957 RepID=A0ABP7K1H4_9MICO